MFAGCLACSEDNTSKVIVQEKGIWQHIWKEKKHPSILIKLIQKCNLQQDFRNQEHVAFSLLSEAIAVDERRHIPLVGASLDRRALQSVGEVFNKDHISVLICCMCGCKHVHYSGYDMFGEPANKGRIYPCCESKWLEKLFSEEAGDEPNASLSLTLFQEFYGDAVANDLFLQRNSPEWVWRVRQSGQPLLCCPEDVKLSNSCKHPIIEICLRCQIPVCHECSGYIQNDEHPPKALANDNFISYAHAFIVEEKVTWLEATIACPIFTGSIPKIWRNRHTHRVVEEAIDI